jgi:hypothetical protein
VFEHFKKSTSANLKVLAVYPVSKIDLHVSEVFDIFLTTSDDLTLLATSTDKRRQICKLMSSKDSKVKIAPSDVVNLDHRTQLSFSFSTFAQNIEPGDCFKLYCEDPASKTPLLSDES